MQGQKYYTGGQLMALATNGDADGGIELSAVYRAGGSPSLGAVSVAVGNGGRRRWFMRVEHDLTARQLEALQFMVMSLLNDHRIPSYADIGAQLGIGSTGSVEAVHVALELNGYIERVPNGGKRFVRILRHPCGRPFKLEAV